MRLSPLDIIIFFTYFASVIIFALTVAARSKTKSSSDFFLASKKLPWYAVGASFIAANISTEHFIGMVGWTFLYGMAVCHWSWLNGITFSILIWIFLPFYMRGNVTTMPEFLERRYNKFCRYVYAVVSLIGMVIAMLGGVMYAGGKAINAFFPQLSVPAAVIILGCAAGIYTVYGGLLSAAWADFLQYCLLMIGGTLVTVFGLHYCGGFSELITALPEKFILFYPPTHETIPWTGIVFGPFAVGIWYSCANQFMVQRCLGARSEWDARMGVVMSGFSQAFLPLIVVVPGIIAFYFFHGQISDGDQSWPYLVRQFLPAGLVGLVLAGLASAVMSTLSAITTSSATIISLDLYKPLVHPEADDREMHRVGRLAGAAVMLIGVALALVMTAYSGITVFGLIQTVFFYVAAPISVIFLVGILWPGATSVAAGTTLVCGFCVFLPLARFVLFQKIPFLQPYDNFMHHTFAVFIMSLLVFFVVSLLTKPKPREELKGVIWSRSALRITASAPGEKHGVGSLAIWWGIMVASIVLLYILAQAVGSQSKLFQAEDLRHETSPAAGAVLQTRQDLAEEGFNLWTGRGQLLFTPSENGASLTLEVPVKRAGWYDIGAIVTRGSDYGSFSAQVNGKGVEIEHAVTKHDRTQRGYNVILEHSEVFDARRLTEAPLEAEAPDSIAADHVVQRINLGTFRIEGDAVRIAFTAAQIKKEPSLIGIDQVILTRATGPGE